MAFLILEAVFLSDNLYTHFSQNLHVYQKLRNPSRVSCKQSSIVSMKYYKSFILKLHMAWNKPKHCFKICYKFNTRNT